MDKTSLESKSNCEVLARQLVPQIIEIGRMCVEFSETNRVTTKDPEGTPESDTDHTFMLSIVACSIAEKYVPSLDLGKVAQFAVVHDLVEVYAQDTSTVFIDDQLTRDKEDREELALAKIKSQFDDSFPWISNTIDEYEKLDTPEARFVKVLDKVMPSITHFLNNASTLKILGVDSVDKLALSVENRTASMQHYNFDQPLAMAIRNSFIELVKARYFE